MPAVLPPHLFDEMIHKAFSSPVRKQILLAIAKKPKYLSQIAKEIKKKPQTIDFHLKVLVEIGMIESNWIQGKKYFSLKKDFEKLKNKGVSDIYSVLRKLWDMNMIKVFKDENEIEYYTLLTDFHVNLIFPKYLLNVIKVLDDQKSKSNKVLIQYLNILEEAYYNLKSEEK